MPEPQRLAAAPLAGKEPEPAPANRAAGRLGRRGEARERQHPHQPYLPVKPCPRSCRARRLTRPLRHSLPSLRTRNRGAMPTSRPPRSMRPAPIGALPAPAGDALRACEQARARWRPGQIGTAAGVSAASPASGTPEPAAAGETRTPGIIPPIASQLDPAPPPLTQRTSQNRINSARAAQIRNTEGRGTGAGRSWARSQARSDRASLRTPELPVPGGEPAAVAAKPPVENSTPAIEPSPPPAPVDAKSPASVSTQIENRSPDAARPPRGDGAAKLGRQARRACRQASYEPAPGGRRLGFGAQ